MRRHGIRRPCGPATGGRADGREQQHRRRAGPASVLGRSAGVGVGAAAPLPGLPGAVDRAVRVQRRHLDADRRRAVAADRPAPRCWCRWCRPPSSLPIVLLALPAGAWADLVDRRRLLLGAQLAMFLAAAALAGTTFLGADVPCADPGCSRSRWAAATRSPARRGRRSSPTWSTAALLPQAAALNGLNMNVARAVGPAIGGLVVAAVGAGLGVRAQRRVVRRHRRGGGRLAGARARRRGTAASGWSRRCGRAAGTSGTR